MTTTTGPKISSEAARSPGSTGASTVGANQLPGPSGQVPRTATGAPSGTNEATLARWDSEMSGPISVASRVGSPTTTPAHRRLEQGEEAVVDRTLDQDARAGAAILPGVVEDPGGGTGGGQLEIGVGEDDVGALAAQLERDPLDLLGAAPP